MGITIKKHRRNLSYDDAATLSELWEITAQFDRSFYRELKDRWDERGYDEYIVAAKGRLRGQIVGAERRLAVLDEHLERGPR